jgi:hypothetical protein
VVEVKQSLNPSGMRWCGNPTSCPHEAHDSLVWIPIKKPKHEHWVLHEHPPTSQFFMRGYTQDRRFVCREILSGRLVDAGRVEAREKIS